MASGRRGFLGLAALGMASAALGAGNRGARMKHVVLLGDSVFDNARYVGGEPDVLARLRSRLPGGWKASLLAVDGSVTRDIPDQVSRLPGDAGALVMSVGGNDALMRQDILEQPSRSVGEALAMLARVLREFERQYRDAVGAAMKPGLPLTVCTIYNGNFPDPAYRERIAAAAALFDDVIIRVATEHRLSVLDLRSVCSRPSDYANAIEPSSSGADRIAQAIVHALGQHDASRPGALILPR
jgi:hypothetical protein